MAWYNPFKPKPKPAPTPPPSQNLPDYFKPAPGSPADIIINPPQQTKVPTTPSPKPSGGGGSSGGGSSFVGPLPLDKSGGGTLPTQNVVVSTSPSDTISGVKEFAQQEKITQTLQQLEQSRKADDFFRGLNTKQSTLSPLDPLVKTYTEKLEGARKSVAPPSEKYVSNLSAGLLRGEKISGEQAVLAFQGIGRLEMERLTEQNININSDRIIKNNQQNYINELEVYRNEPDYWDLPEETRNKQEQEILNKWETNAKNEFNTWANDFQANVLNPLEKRYGDKVALIQKKFEISKRASLKELGKTFVKSFASGARTGAGLTLAQRAIGFGAKAGKTAGKTAIGAGIGLGLGLFMGAQSVAGGIRAGTSEYKRSGDIKRAGLFASAEFATGVAEAGTSLIGFGSGAYAGSKLATGIANLDQYGSWKGLTKQDQAIIKKLQKERGDLFTKDQLVKSNVAEGEIRRSGLDKLIKKEGWNIKQVSVEKWEKVIDTKGLTPRQLEAVNKLKFSAPVYTGTIVIQDKAGNLLVKQVFSGYQKSGGLVFWTRTPTYTGEIRGVWKDGKFTGARVTAEPIKKPLIQRIDLLGQQTGKMRITTEKIDSAGQIIKQDGLNRVVFSRGIITPTGVKVITKKLPLISSKQNIFTYKTNPIKTDATTFISTKGERYTRSLFPSGAKVFTGVEGVSYSRKLTSLTDIKPITIKTSTRADVGTGLFDKPITTIKPITQVQVQKQVSTSLFAPVKPVTITQTPILKSEIIMAPLSLKQENKQIQKQIQAQDLSLGLIPIALSKSAIAQRQKEEQVMGIIPSNIKGRTSLFIPAQQQQQKTKLITTPMTITKLKQPIPIAPNLNIPIWSLPKPFAFGLGGIEVGGSAKGSASVKIFGKQTKYNPSLGSILLGRKPQKVTKEQATLLGKTTFSGFELRPEIEIENGKGKKKKGLGLF